MENLAERLEEIEKMEGSLPKEIAPLVKDVPSLYYTDLYIFGAAHRTKALSRGFRTMIETRNFPVAAIILRTQIDTAMRVNGLTYMDRPEDQMKELFKGKLFRKLESRERTDKNKAIQMHDVYLRSKIVEDVPWMDKVYKKSSDFVHLSSNALFSRYNKPDDSGRISFEITGDDPPMDESGYFEICDAFIAVTRHTHLIIISLLEIRQEKLKSKGLK